MNDDEVPWTDDLEKLGFEFSDHDTMFMYCGANGDGPQVVVTVESNTFRDDCGLAKSLSLYWLVSRHPTKVSGTFGIRDNPTLGQIKTLVGALKGE